jgi:hypothetical protein
LLEGFGESSIPKLKLLSDATQLLFESAQFVGA